MYSNIYTNAHPGLILFILDKSIAMDDIYGESSCIEAATRVINTLINDLIMDNYDSIMRGGGKMVYLAIIEHGGCDNEENINVLCNGWLRDYEFKREEIVEKKCSDEEERIIEFNLFRWAEPHAKGEGNVAGAFEMACEYLEGWSQRGGDNLNWSPVPLVINLISGQNTGLLLDDNYRMERITKRIKSMVFPDGNPLVFNMVINTSNKMTVFPDQCPEDTVEACLYNLSSIIPKTLSNFYNHGYAEAGRFNYEGLRNGMDLLWTKKKLTGKERLYVSNLSVADLIAFGRSLLDFFNMEWCGMCVGEPNPLLFD